MLKKIVLPDKEEFKKDARIELDRKIKEVEKAYKKKLKFKEKRWDKWIDHVYAKANNKRFLSQKLFEVWFTKQLIADMRRFVK